VSINAKGADVQTVSHKFIKSVEPKLVEITLGGSGQRIEFKD